MTHICGVSIENISNHSKTTMIDVIFRISIKKQITLLKHYLFPRKITVFSFLFCAQQVTSGFLSIVSPFINTSMSHSVLVQYFIQNVMLCYWEFGNALIFWCERMKHLACHIFSIACPVIVSRQLPLIVQSLRLSNACPG